MSGRKAPSTGSEGFKQLIVGVIRLTGKQYAIGKDQKEDFGEQGAVS